MSDDPKTSGSLNQSGDLKPIQEDPMNDDQIESLADLIADTMNAKDSADEDTGSFNAVQDEDTGEFEPVKDTE